MIKNGLYKVSVGTELGAGNSVAVLNNGRVLGGDSMMAFEGTYEVDGAKFTATINTSKHSNVERMFSLTGNDNATINIAGTINGDDISGSGKSSQNPSINLSANLSKIYDA